ncbi:ATP-binding cassette sub-family B member 6, mitochondrial isoform X1 [Hyposmocoma kahamanoa]|uniref:ATP-binding cassette sub-family B member 6, mitochondrial isoform X1 n=1 Tax=Hyposmocoma kahamanoa TaxID=1477025 RepID=UPI000E6D6E59|nr:ATP-binding cassette sub-family B member 6, mitochondrial isoform X1 [Hyposmocoma kahamanoa]
MKMEYCPPNVTLGEVWVDHGISQCFMETVSGAIIGGFLIICGIMQIVMYKRYATEVTDVRCSRLFGVQIFFTILIPILGVIRFLLQALVFKGGHIYGYMILALIVSLIVFPLSAYLAILERRYLLPSVPPRGHGFVLLVFWAMVFVSENLSFLNLNKEGWWWHLRDLQDRLEMALFVGRYVSCMIMFILGMKAPGIMHQFELLVNEDIRRNLPPRNENRSTFRNVFSKLRILLPFLWPRKNFCLQLNVLICVLALIGGRIVNLYVPIYNKKIVDSISPSTTQYFCWDLVLIYVFFKFLQGGGTGGMGFLNNLRSFLWIRVQQYTTRELELELFKHLHELPLRWHLSRKTGEVLRVMDRGTDSIDNLLSYILFSITPTIVDILIAIGYFVTAFNVWFGFIVFSTMVLYIIATIAVTEWRTKYQRRMNLADNEQKARSVDSLLNYETVKYYGAENYEVMAYKDCILNYQKEEFNSLITLNMLNTMQNIIICSGLLAGSLLAIHMVVETRQLTVGDYVLFASYIVQLYVPLNWFGTYYRAIQKNFVDMENMFDLMREEADVKDAIGAPELLVRRGAVEFKHVSFGYGPERLVLNNINFKVAPGSTVALVGPSGAGKSTIMRLLFRFYDVNEGAVLVDGQDVRTVTQSSLRSNIGVVPQDTVLFNNTVRYNIQYGKLDAPTADIIAAAKNADIHDRILTFPDAYDTRVGERGLKLSGGEKQRIAIARTILKDPTIVLLDEATSALDTNTERNIQAALARVCANRTTIIIAHRLSTIIHADEILVLKDGEIIERGNHEALLAQGGFYASMWQQQLESRNSAALDAADGPNNNNEPHNQPSNGLSFAHTHGFA